MAKYIYPAIFAPENDGGFSVTFPDIKGCYTCGDSLEESLSMAEDALSLMLVHLEDEKRQIPAPSGINELEMHGEEFASLISADTILYRKTLNNKDENVVIVSELEYTELDRIRKNAEYLAKIDRAIDQKNAGTMMEHDLIEE